MYTAEEIRNKQGELTSVVNKQVDYITNTIYELIQGNPDETYCIFQHTFDKNVKTKLESLGYKVDEYLGGVYADAWWTKITWDN